MTILNLVLIGFITIFFSFFVQVGFYIWYKYTEHNLIKDYKTVFNYTSGIIGDGILVPLTNIFAFLTMNGTNQNFFSLERWIFAGISGVGITYLFHHGQQYYKLTNWTMPAVGHWNLLGIYHAFFMFFESTLLCYVLYSYLQAPSVDSQLKDASFIYGLLVLWLFLISFIYDYWDSLFKRLLK